MQDEHMLKYCSFQVVLALLGVLLAPTLAEEVSTAQ